MLIRKDQRRGLLAQLRGARKLRQRGEPYFVWDNCSALTEVPLGLNKQDFPRILVGAHGPVAEMLLRQIFLRSFGVFSKALMKSVGSGKPLGVVLPPAWLDALEAEGISCSRFWCGIGLFMRSILDLTIGTRRFLALLSQIGLPDPVNSRYVVFLSLLPENLPAPDGAESYDVISWYRKSSLHRAGVGKIWAQVSEKHTEGWSKDDLLLSPMIFPKFGSARDRYRFMVMGLKGLIVALGGVLLGRWWYGMLFREAALYYYTRVLSSEQLAEGYYFNNSNWYYKPLWAEEVEARNRTATLYFYSTNMELLNVGGHPLHKQPAYGYWSMSWNRFVVWDRQQEEYLRKFRPGASFIKVGFVDFSGKKFHVTSRQKKCRIAVFDVTPVRPVVYTGLGWAAPYYYNEELSLSFFSSIVKVFEELDVDLMWKKKRVGLEDRKGFCARRDSIIEGHILVVDPDVSARSLVNAASAVIAMPFSSPAILGKIKGIPSIYFDPSGEIDENENHGNPVIKGTAALRKWASELSIVGREDFHQGANSLSTQKKREELI